VGRRYDAASQRWTWAIGHLHKIQIGRDYGDNLEVISGLELGDMVITNPGDAVVEGVKNRTCAGGKSLRKTGSEERGKLI
jgi:hypothetical protein